MEIPIPKRKKTSFNCRVYVVNSPNGYEFLGRLNEKARKFNFLKKKRKKN